MAQNAPPRAQTAYKHLFEQPKGSRNNFEKNVFFPRWGPWWTHRWPQPCAGRAAHWLHQVTTGTGVYVGRWAIVRLGNHLKRGGFGWTRCPGNSGWSHVAQDTARAWLRGVGARCADFVAFWHLFGPFLGHIVELKGTRGLFDTAKSSRACSVATVSLVLGVSPGFGGYFGQKMAVFGPTPRKFGRAPLHFAPPPRGTTGEFLAQNLDLARAAPRLQDG